MFNPTCEGAYKRSSSYCNYMGKQGIKHFTKHCWTRGVGDSRSFCFKNQSAYFILYIHPYGSARLFHRCTEFSMFWLECFSGTTCLSLGLVLRRGGRGMSMPVFTEQIAERCLQNFHRSMEIRSLHKERCRNRDFLYQIERPSTTPERILKKWAKDESQTQKE